MDAYGQFALVYDRLMEDMPYDEWVTFTEAAWKHYGIVPKSVADIGCGTGSVALPLAQRGYQVIGIDLSESMLSIAREKESQLGRMRGCVQWVCQDMREWSVPEPVDTVVCYCDSINYLTETEDVRSFIQQTYSQLRPGGLFLFDMHHERQFEQYATEQPFTLDEGDVAYDRIDETHLERAYDPDWIIKELKLAGFDEVNLHGEFQLADPDETSNRLFVAARKR